MLGVIHNIRISLFKKLALDNNLAEKLDCMIHKDNLPSKKVTKRNGVTLEGTINVWNLPLVTSYNL